MLSLTKLDTHTRIITIVIGLFFLLLLLLSSLSASNSGQDGHMPPNEVQRLLRGILEVRLDSLMLGFQAGYTQIQVWNVILQTQIVCCILLHPFGSLWSILVNGCKWMYINGISWSSYAPFLLCSLCRPWLGIFGAGPPGRARPLVISTSRACCTEISNLTIWWYDARQKSIWLMKSYEIAMRITSEQVWLWFWRQNGDEQWFTTTNILEQVWCSFNII